MSDNKFKYQGLEELKEDLRTLPEELRFEGNGIVVSSATEAGSEIRALYSRHRRSGDLASKVVVQQLSAAGRYFVGAIVKNTSKIAFIFENGTEARHTKTGDFRGRMPPAHIFVPTVMRKRKEMYEKLRQLLRRKGLKA